MELKERTTRYFVCPVCGGHLTRLTEQSFVDFLCRKCSSRLRVSINKDDLSISYVEKKKGLTA